MSVPPTRRWHRRTATISRSSKIAATAIAPKLADVVAEDPPADGSAASAPLPRRIYEATRHLPRASPRRRSRCRPAFGRQAVPRFIFERPRRKRNPLRALSYRILFPRGAARNPEYARNIDGSFRVTGTPGTPAGVLFKPHDSGLLDTVETPRNRSRNNSRLGVPKPSEQARTVSGVPRWLGLCLRPAR